MPVFGVKAGERLENIPTRLIVQGESQLRKNFSEDELARLADSIRQYGVLVPLCVKALNDGRGTAVYELISGARRLRACRLLCMQTVPCIIKSADGRTAFEQALSENLLHCELDMFEQAEAIDKLMRCEMMSEKETASRLSVSESYISNKLKLLEFAPHERQLILYAKIPERYARSLLRFGDSSERLAAINSVIEGRGGTLRAESTAAAEEKAESGEAVSRRIKVKLKDTRMFTNTVEKAVELLRQSGVSVSYENSRCPDGGTEFRIKVAAE